MVETKEIVEIYRSTDESYKDEIEELNKALSKLQINCIVSCEESDDGETLIFKKIDMWGSGCNPQKELEAKESS